jgi:hypothetical protein
MVGLGLLTGMVLLAKLPYWVSLLFSYSLIVWNILKHRESVDISRLLRAILILVVLIFCVIAPVKIINPWVKGYSSTRFDAMREARASAEYRPGNPTQPGYRLASRGWPFTQILDAYGDFWMGRSAESFYGRFGSLDVRLPKPVYLAIAEVILFSLLVTYGILIYRWRAAPGSLKLLLFLAPCAIGLSILSSLYNSWVHDVQPQGRYLFSALAPLAVMMGGTVDIEPSLISDLRAGVWIALFLFCIFLLWHFVLHNPVFY